ncbi:MAG: SPFH domain-containing protein [Gammaproteobacteria bacterium]|nr:SPFH domain-containing protein [Gammaproteobacteria bacterium]MBI5615147.1 SPFH domain-containing protein [Gammaproteobacteria bacterium]
MDTQIEERSARALPGFLALAIWFALAGWIAWSFIGNSVLHDAPPEPLAIFGIPLLFLLGKGFTILEPNQAAVMIFFGTYAGTLRDGGFYWVNPFYKKRKLSLRANNLNTPTLKVNDLAGNPIEVAAVIVWRVADTARATFDVEDYVAYVTMQSESAVRKVVSSRWYDGDTAGENSLRGDLDAVARALAETIQEHVVMAGLEIVEARITHLAYAPEIAGAMLRRQQAAAVVAARTQIVEGAVSMLKMSLDRLESEGIVKLGEAERVRLVTNLMTVLVSESETQPVVSVASQ